LRDLPPAEGGDAALNELRAGRPGPAVIELVGRMLVAVARRHGHPHPDPDVAWRDPDAVETAVSVFFAEGKGQLKLDTLALEATSDKHLRALVRTTVRNWFADLTRETPRGRLHRSTKRRLEEEPDLFMEIAPKDFWTLLHDPREPGIVDDATLDRALASVPVTIIRARPNGTNERPWASRDDQVAALQAMLTEAAMAVILKAIVRAIAARIGLLPRPTTIEIDAAGEPNLPGGAVAVQAGDSVGDAERAAEIFEQLSDRERRVLIRAEQTTRQIEEETGIPRSSISDVRRRLREALQRTNVVNEHGLLAELAALCERFDIARTTTADSSSSFDEGGDREL
jgi:hypothetical protein